MASSKMAEPEFKFRLLHTEAEVLNLPLKNDFRCHIDICILTVNVSNLMHIRKI